MLTPEREAEIRKIVGRSNPDDNLYKDEALMLLAEIDRLRAELKKAQYEGEQGWERAKKAEAEIPGYGSSI